MKKIMYKICGALFLLSTPAAFLYSSYVFALEGPDAEWVLRPFLEKLLAGGFMAFVFSALWVSILAVVLALPLFSEEIDAAREELSLGIMIEHPYLFAFILSFFQFVLWGKSFTPWIVGIGHG